MKTREKPDFCIDPTDDDFGALCNCAVRYCLGRRSYMPKVIVDYITPLLPKLNDRTLDCFRRDIMERERTGYNFGDGYYLRMWDEFHLAVCSEIADRSNEEEK